jgi:hypothetical protein
MGDEDAQRLIPLVAALWPIFGCYLWNECPQLEPPETEARRLLRAAALRDGTPPPPPPPPLTDETRMDYERKAAALLYALHEKTKDATDSDQIAA